MVMFRASEEFIQGDDPVFVLVELVETFFEMFSGLFRVGRLGGGGEEFFLAQGAVAIRVEYFEALDQTVLMTARVFGGRSGFLSEDVLGEGKGGASAEKRCDIVFHRFKVP